MADKSETGCTLQTKCSGLKIVRKIVQTNINNTCSNTSVGSQKTINGRTLKSSITGHLMLPQRIKFSPTAWRSSIKPILKHEAWWNDWFLALQSWKRESKNTQPKSTIKTINENRTWRVAHTYLFDNLMFKCDLFEDRLDGHVTVTKRIVRQARL